VFDLTVQRHSNLLRRRLRQWVAERKPGAVSAFRRGVVWAVLWTVCLGVVGSLSAADPLVQVTFADAKNHERRVDGKIVVEAVDGGIVLMGRDGRLWNITPKQIRRRTATDKMFSLFTAKELGGQLQSELGKEFRIVRTKHYVICTSTGSRYAQWCGALFERLLTGFRSHWRARGLTLHEPPGPLIAVILADRKQFTRFAAADVGSEARMSTGYYSIRSNRMVLYDLTAGEAVRPARTVQEIVRRVSASPLTVATVVHEATHQIAFNSGLHTRYADNPLWLTEGMAMYFEVPDLRSRAGWRTVGNISPTRMRRFRSTLRRGRKSGSLERLVTEDQRFNDPKTAADAYAQAWALTYFLIRKKGSRYASYLKTISRKRPLRFDKPAQRLIDFRKAFGDDLDRLDRDFLRYMRRR